MRLEIPDSKQAKSIHDKQQIYCTFYGNFDVIFLKFKFKSFFRSIEV